MTLEWMKDYQGKEGRNITKGRKEDDYGKEGRLYQGKEGSLSREGRKIIKGRKEDYQGKEGRLLREGRKIIK